jgi:hypothetical protein
MCANAHTHVSFIQLIEQVLCYLNLIRRLEFKCLQNIIANSSYKLKLKQKKLKRKLNSKKKQGRRIYLAEAHPFGPGAIPAQHTVSEKGRRLPRAASISVELLQSNDRRRLVDVQDEGH